jgi:hypothetical protein
MTEPTEALRNQVLSKRYTLDLDRTEKVHLSPYTVDELVIDLVLRQDLADPLMTLFETEGDFVAGSLILQLFLFNYLTINDIRDPEELNHLVEESRFRSQLDDFILAIEKLEDNRLELRDANEPAMKKLMDQFHISQAEADQRLDSNFKQTVLGGMTGLAGEQALDEYLDQSFQTRIVDSIYIFKEGETQDIPDDLFDLVVQSLHDAGHNELSIQWVLDNKDTFRQRFVDSGEVLRTQREGQDFIIWFQNDQIPKLRHLIHQYEPPVINGPDLFMDPFLNDALGPTADPALKAELRAVIKRRLFEIAQASPLGTDKNDNQVADVLEDKADMLALLDIDGYRDVVNTHLERVFSGTDAGELFLQHLGAAGVSLVDLALGESGMPVRNQRGADRLQLGEVRSVNDLIQEVVLKAREAGFITPPLPRDQVNSLLWARENVILPEGLPLILQDKIYTLMVNDFGKELSSATFHEFTEFLKGDLHIEGMRILEYTEEVIANVLFDAPNGAELLENWGETETSVIEGWANLKISTNIRTTEGLHREVSTKVVDREKIIVEDILTELGEGLFQNLPTDVFEMATQIMQMTLDRWRADPLKEFDEFADITQNKAFLEDVATDVDFAIGQTYGKLTSIFMAEIGINEFFRLIPKAGHMSVEDLETAIGDNTLVLPEQGRFASIGSGVLSFISIKAREAWDPAFQTFLTARQTELDLEEAAKLKSEIAAQLQEKGMSFDELVALGVSQGLHSQQMQLLQAEMDEETLRLFRARVGFETSDVGKRLADLDQMESRRQRYEEVYRPELDRALQKRFGRRAAEVGAFVDPTMSEQFFQLGEQIRSEGTARFGEQALGTGEGEDTRFEFSAENFTPESFIKQSLGDTGFTSAFREARIARQRPVTPGITSKIPRFAQPRTPGPRFSGGRAVGVG